LRPIPRRRPVRALRRVSRRERGVSCVARLVSRRHVPRLRLVAEPFETTWREGMGLHDALAACVLARRADGGGYAVPMHGIQLLRERETSR